MIRAVVFDLDGTLLNTIDDINDSLNYALEQNGFSPITLEDTKRYIGNGVSMLIHRALASSPHNEIQEANIKDCYSLEYTERKTNKTNVYYGIKELIEYLQENEIKMAVLSNKDHSDTTEIIEKYFGNNVFDVVVGKQKGFPTKPDPSLLFEVLSQLHVHHEEVIYVGDSEADMEVANNANLKKIGCAYGYRNTDILNIYNPDFVVNSPLDIIQIIKDINTTIEEEIEIDDDDASQASNKQL
ncbi:MAG: HAD family hydrolase [Bacilli bacterium]